MVREAKKDVFLSFCEMVIMVYPDFGSKETRKKIEEKQHQIDEWTDEAIAQMNQDLTDSVFLILMDIYGDTNLPSGEKAYWALGVKNANTRMSAATKQQSVPDAQQRKPIEAYIDLIQLKDIITDHWDRMSNLFNIPLSTERSGKARYLSWLDRLNEVRRVQAHRNAHRWYQPADVEFVAWIRKELSDRLGNSGFVEKLHNYRARARNI